MVKSSSTKKMIEQIDAGQSLECYLAELESRHLENLSYILQVADTEVSVAQVADAIRWRYHSKARSALKTGAGFVFSRIKKPGSKVSASESSVPSVPTYSALLLGLAHELQVFEPSVTLVQIEKYVIYGVMTDCLQRMTSEQRVRFFEQTVELSAVLGDGIIDSGISAPMTTLSALGLASASGAGVYTAAATVLGMLTHGFGITLPFAVYAGVNSTIGFVLGPLGWLAAGGWLAWRVTEPDWKVLTQVVVYLITERNSPAHFSKPLSA